MEKTLSPQEEEENGRQKLMAVQMDDFDTQRVEKSRTSDEEERSAYVEGKKRLEGIKAWRCESLLFLFYSENISAYPIL